MNRPPKKTKDDRRRAAAARDRINVVRWVERLIGGFRPEEPTAHDAFFLHVIEHYPWCAAEGVVDLMTFAFTLAPLMPDQTPAEIVDSLEGLRETPVGKLLLESMPAAWGVKLAAAVQALARPPY